MYTLPQSKLKASCVRRFPHSMHNLHLFRHIYIYRIFCNAQLTNFAYAWICFRVKKKTKQILCMYACIWIYATKITRDATRCDIDCVCDWDWDCDCEMRVLVKTVSVTLWQFLSPTGGGFPLVYLLIIDPLVGYFEWMTSKKLWALFKILNSDDPLVKMQWKSI